MRAAVSFRFETRPCAVWFRFVSFRFSSHLEPCRFVSFRFHFKKISSPLFRFVSHLQNTQLFMSLFRFFKKNGFDPYPTEIPKQ